MKDIIKAVKAYFSIKKILKTEGMEKINLESIRKIWTLVAGMGLLDGLKFLPDWIKALFTPAGTEITFDTAGVIQAAIFAVIAWWQFTRKRTGEDKPQELRGSEGSNVAYLLNPFKAA